MSPFNLNPVPFFRVWICRLKVVLELPEAGKIGILKLAHDGSPFLISAMVAGIFGSITTLDHHLGDVFAESD